MEAITLKAAAREVRDLCVPGRVRSVSQVTQRDAVLTLGGGRAPHIVLGVNPDHPTLFATSRRPPAIPAPTAFCRLLRKELGGLVLTAVESPAMERSVELSFAPSGSEKPLRRLVVEIMGRWSNLLLVDGAGVLVDTLHHVSPREPGGRALLPGEEYLPPPDGGRLDVTTVSEEEFARLEGLREEEGVPLAAGLVGLGPGLLALAGQEGEPSLLASIRRVIARVGEEAPKPVWYDRRKILLPFPVTAWEGEDHRSFPSICAAAGHLFGELSEDGERGRIASRLRRHLTRRRGKLKKKAQRVEEESGKGGEEAEMRRIGQALLGLMGKVPKGTESVDLPDPADPDVVAGTVELDPALDLRRNAEAYFRRARKAKRRTDLAAGRLPAIEREVGRMDRQIAALAGLSLDELRGMEKRGAPRASPSAVRKAKPSRIREYRREDGWRILVGKNSAGNDELTTKVARPDDFWFHARDFPGAHVLLKGPRPVDAPPPELLAAAGEAAAWHSAAREEKAADVSWTQRKHVRKVKGSPAGSVLVPKAKTVRVRPRVPEGFREV